jgi:hypothetical protein
MHRTIDRRTILLTAVSCALGALALNGPVRAADEPTFTLTIVNHKWDPAELIVPANTKVKLIVRNNDDSPEEFDSKSLNREKVIAAKSEATIYIGPLAPGRYPFEGEFHPQTAQGVVVAQ